MPVFDPAHAPYVWSVYALAAIMIGAMILATALAARKAKRAHKDITKAREDTAS